MSNLYALLISLAVVVGLIVLIAMGKITWGDGGPLIAAIIGVHSGGALAAATPAAQQPPTPVPAPKPPTPPAA